MKQTNISSLIKLFFGWPLGLLALYFIWRLIAPSGTKLFLSLFHLNGWLLLCGIICLLVYFFLRAYLWYRIVQEYKNTLTLRETVYYWALAELKRYIPGSIWSIASRVIHFSGIGINKKDVGKAYLKEAELIVLGSFFVSLLGVSFFAHHFPPFPFETAIILAVGVVILIFYFWDFKRHEKSILVKYLSLFTFKGSFQEKIILLSITFSAFFFFGLGSFLIISSFVSLPLQSIYLLIGFLALTYLVGYLPFFIPSGIGVREGMIILGLQSLIGTSAAGFAALFSRVILLIAELFFLLFVILWQKTKYFLNLEKIVKKYPYTSLLFIFIILYNIYFTSSSFARYDNFYTGRFDLGNMAQTVWNTSHGRIFQLTDPNGTYNVSRLATHADFFLILLAPFYYIWSDPRMLLLIQTIVLSLGAIYVYLLAKKICKNKLIALIFSFMYLLNPSVERTNIYDFHAVTLATTFLLAAFYYMLQKRCRWFLVFAILAGLTKEQVWIIVGFFGLYIALVQRKIIFGVSIFVSSCAIFYYLIAYAIPGALGSQHFALSYYSDFGDTPLSVMKNIFQEPMKVVSLMVGREQLHFLQQIFSSIGYLSLFAPLYLLFASLEFLISLLSNNPNLHQIYYQYTASITPFLFIAAIYGVSYIRKFFPRIPICVIPLYLVFACLTTAYFYGPLPGSVEANADMFTKPLTDSQVIDHFLQTIPKRYRVAASNNLGSHLSHRQNIYTIPVGIDKADVIAFLMTDPGAQPSVAFHENLIAKFRKDPKYVIWYEKGPFIVFRRAILPASPPRRQSAK